MEPEHVDVDVDVDMGVGVRSRSMQGWERIERGWANRRALVLAAAAAVVVETWSMTGSRLWAWGIVQQWQQWGLRSWQTHRQDQGLLLWAGERKWEERETMAAN